MVNYPILRATIKTSGIPITVIAKKIGCSRESLYKKLAGTTQFKESEIIAFQQALRLTSIERNQIFFGD